ncbi:MAG: hypothetical protein AAF449_05970 [Myxococcota bacterium]
MDILSNIIFFLMASFGAAVVAMVPVSVPTISESGDSDKARDENKVTATLRIRADGSATITAANDEIRPDELAKFKQSFSAMEGGIDARSINDHLWSIKSQFQESSGVWR